VVGLLRGGALFRTPVAEVFHGVFPLWPSDRDRDPRDLADDHFVAADQDGLLREYQ
jgi:hypothetical protein